MAINKQWKMFRAKGDWAKNVHIDWYESHTPSVMADGFKEAADATMSWISEQAGHPDRYFYPVAFLYRHAVELQLKCIISLGRKLYPTPACKTNCVGHKLVELWNDALEVFKLVFEGHDKEVLDAAFELLKELDEADPDGQSFRYYRNRKGDINLSHLPKVFSLEKLQQEVHRLIDFLSGCECGVDMAVEYQEEMEAEMRSNSY